MTQPASDDTHRLVVGLDDIGTGSQKLYGFTFLVLAKEPAAWLNAEGKRLLPRNQRAFHGKEFAKRFEGNYRCFLEKVGYAMTNTVQSCGGPVLRSQGSADSYRSRCETILRAGPGNSLTEDDRARLLPYFEAIATVLDHSEELGPDMTMRFEMDQSTKLPRLQTDDVAHLVEVARAYRAAHRPKAPEMEDGGFQFLPDEQSIMIQAADVLGNFGMARVKQLLGTCSKSNDLKARIWSSVFTAHESIGDISSLQTLQDEPQLSGNGLLLLQGQWKTASQRKVVTSE